jgi:16S rRNA (adenine1518-N6/adenine1519-N6)-dimethyltransferase
LTVIEFDRDLITPLMESAEGMGDLTIIHKDVLKVDFTKLAADRPAIRLVGNLPYNTSTPILFHVLEHAPVVRDMHFMLQKEVIDRMAAEPGSKVYGRLTVMLQARCEVTPLFMVPPHAFRPPPKVDSAVVRLVPLAADKIQITDAVLFENLVRDAFGQRRKTIRNAMQALATSDDIEAQNSYRCQILLNWQTFWPQNHPRPRKLPACLQNTKSPSP